MRPIVSPTLGRVARPATTRHLLPTLPLLLILCAPPPLLRSQPVTTYGERPEYRWSGEVGYSSTVQEVTPEQVRAALPRVMPEHPYLYFDADGMARIRERLERDPESAAIRDDLLAIAFKLLHQPVEMQVPVHITYPGGRSLDFQDSKGGRIGSTHLYNKLAAEYGDPTAAWIRQTHFGAGRGVWDLIWPRAVVAPAPPAQASREFRTWGWWVMRTDFTDPERVMLAGMAGRNNEPHHGHLSVGHVVLRWRGESYIRDLGSPTYDQLFFNEVRWSHYPHAMSEGHNVVFVNGERQLPGKRKNQPWNHSIGGRILDFQTSKARDYVLTDNAAAYPGREMLGWRRHVVHVKDLQATVVLDEVRARPGAEIEARFHPGVPTRPAPGHLLLTGSGGTLAHIPLSDGPVERRDGRHAIQIVHGAHDLQHEPFYGWITRARGDGSTPLVSLLLPVADGEAAAETARTVRLERRPGGALRIGFDYAGQPVTLDFEQAEDGWRWVEPFGLGNAYLSPSTHLPDSPPDP